jgi:hypothetical protein
MNSDKFLEDLGRMSWDGCPSVSGDAHGCPFRRGIRSLAFIVPHKPTQK